MTIYALVNGFTASPGDSGTEPPVWTLISPAAILQGGNPYFVPDFASRFEAMAAMALRIGKLGKGIAPRFAPRYIDAIAPAALFVAADLLPELRKAGLPWTSAVSYDRSLAVGKFVTPAFSEIPSYRCSLRLEACDPPEENTETSAGQNTDIGAVLEAISRDNTLKTGDIILAGITGKGPALRPGMKASLLADGKENLRFNIR